MDEKKDTKRVCDIINIIFAAAVVLFLVLGLVFTLFFPSDVNEYENRKSEKIKPLSADSYADGSFQDSTEKALADNILCSTDMKKLYNDVTGSYLRFMTDKTVMNADVYVKLGSFYLFKRENILYSPGEMKHLARPISKHAQEYNRIAEKYPELDFYVYYVERDSDINFETGKKSGMYDLLKEKLNYPEERVARFEVTDFEQFKKYYYKTDHHWNADGSYKGYTEILQLLECYDEPIPISASVVFPERYVGSKVKTNPAAKGYSDEFKVHRYLFPDMKVTMVGGVPAYDYGEQQNWLWGWEEHSEYSKYYGEDFGEVVFDTLKDKKENLLIIGESYDNAVIKLIASHFNKTCAVDLRFYEPYMHKDFDFASYVSEHDIDKVLFMGAVDYFVMDEFLPEIK